MRSLSVLVLFCGLGTLACEVTHMPVSLEAAESDVPSDHPDPVQPVSCNGLCIGTAPATYTGPSLFWLGLPAAVPVCPPGTPHEGIEGIVQGTQVAVLAKECRITPSDLCSDEGLTCAPIPEPDLHLCIHHDGEAGCPSDYPERATISEVETHMPVTLCCQKPTLPG